MARRRPLEPSENHERWLISYADFITLLFAFFVVMYSTSSMNNGDFRVLSDAIVRAFGLPGVSFSESRPEGDGARSMLLGMPVEEGAKVTIPLRVGAEDPAQTAPSSLAGISEAVQTSLEDELATDRIAPTVDGDFVELALPARLLFPSGSRALLIDASPLLARLGEVLAALPNQVIVEGHTDDQPIRNGLFESNWDLSTARAVAVVRRLEGEGVASERLSAVGYGSTRPLVSNDTEAGQAANRRVVLRIRSATPGADDG